MKIKEFMKKELGNVRTVYKDTECFFHASDVADILEIANKKQMLRGLDPDEKVSLRVETAGGPQTITFLTESGLYRTIFKSRKPCAKVFKKWITSEVIPTIRKTGGYFEEEELLPKEEREALNKMKKICVEWIEAHKGVSAKEEFSDRIGDTIYDICMEAFAVQSERPKTKVVDREGRIIRIYSA